MKALTKTVEACVTIREEELVVTGLVHLYPGYRQFEVEVQRAVLDGPAGQPRKEVSLDEWTRVEIAEVEEALFQAAIA